MISSQWVSAFPPSLLESKPSGLLEYITAPALRAHTALRLSLQAGMLVSASLVPATWHDLWVPHSAHFPEMGPALSKGAGGRRHRLLLRR